MKGDTYPFLVIERVKRGLWQVVRKEVLATVTTKADAERELHALIEQPKES